MHSGEGFARVQGEIAHLLNLYRSATLEILEDMMRHSQLKKIADAYTKKKVRIIVVCVMFILQIHQP